MLALDRDNPGFLAERPPRLVNAEKVAIASKSYNPVLRRRSVSPCCTTMRLILWVKLRDFDGGAALVQPNFRVGQAGEIMVTELLSPSLKKAPGVRRISALPSEYPAFDPVAIQPNLLPGRRGLACDRGMSFDIIILPGRAGFAP